MSRNNPPDGNRPNFFHKPLYYAAILIAFGISLQQLFNIDAIWWVVVFLGPAAAWIVCRPAAAKRRALGAIGLAAMLVGFGWGRAAWSERAAQGALMDWACRSESNQVRIRGEVVSDVESRPGLYGGPARRRFTLRARQAAPGLSGESFVPANVRIVSTATDDGLPLEIGDRLELAGRVKVPRRATNPGGFDGRAFWRARSVRLLFYSDPHIAAKHLGSDGRYQILRILARLRSFLIHRAEKDFTAHPQAAALLNALFFGYRLDLDQATSDLFFKTGTIHLLAVSGFNIAFVMVIVAFFLKLLHPGRKSEIIIQIGAVWFYCALAGFQSPVVRATVMATAYLVGGLAGRKSDVLNSLGFAAICILMFIPEQMGDLGFQLSFLSVWALCMLMPVFMPAQSGAGPGAVASGPFQKITGYFKSLFWMSFVCSIATLPITIQYFYVVSPVALLANLMVVPLTFVIFMIGAVYYALTLLPAVPAVLLGTATVSIEFLFAILRFCESLPGASVIIGKLDYRLWLALVLGLVYLTRTAYLKRPVLRACLIIMYIAGILMSQECVRAGSREFRITMIDVGQGDSTFIEFEDGKSMIIDAGPGAGFDCGRSVIAPFLKSKGVRSIDALIITHPQDDHMGGIGSLQEIFRVKRVYLAAVFKNNKYVRHLIKDKILDPERMGWLSAGDRLEGFGGTQIDTIHPPYRGESEDVNESSLVLRMRHSDLTALFCADIKDKTMTRLAASERYIRADILKVPHHGARLKNGGRSFIEQVCPRLSLISVGEHNRFGHPSPETITALENINANTVFRTDLDGAVEINLEPPSGIKVQSFYSKKILRWPLRPSLSL